ncbi:MAG: diguanylate cyclase [Phycisphaerales bacterium JB063]
MHAVVIDDDPVTRMMLSEELAAFGISVDMAGDAESGMKLVREKQPDLCLVDWVMPGAFGISLVRAVRESPELADTYIIMVTAMSRVEELAMAFNAGVDDYICKPVQKIELASRLRAATRLAESRKQVAKTVREVNHLNTLLQDANTELHHLATTDALTQLPNRMAVCEGLEKAWAQYARYDVPLHVAILDADHFKQINDRYGHAAGDCVLKQLANTIKSETRSVDTVGRFGGEEFVIGIPHLSTQEAMEAVDRLRQVVADTPVAIEGGSVRVTVSVGLSAASPKTARLDRLLAQADEALYSAKESGRNRVVMHLGSHRVVGDKGEAA